MQVQANADNTTDDSPSASPGWLEFGRLAAAMALTAGCLPYAVGRCVVVGLLQGEPERQFLQLALVLVALNILFAAGLGDRLGSSPWRRRVGWQVGLLWIAANLAILYFLVGPLLPWQQVAVPFIAAMLWVPWLAWIFYCRRNLARRVVVLGLLLGLSAAIFTMVLRVDGLTGDSKVNFAWRWSQARGAELAARPAGDSVASAVEAADLTVESPNNYPQYLGVDRRGVVATARLAPTWDASPPRVLWKRSIGLGWSGFAVVGDYAVTQEQRGPQECTVCYRVSDGKEVWIHAEQNRFVSGMGGDGPRCTPAIECGKVYSLGPTGILLCLRGSDGKALWKTNILDDNQAENVHHGVSGSPLVFEGKVVVSPTGANGISLAAYDAQTGTRLWRAGDKQTSYSSPMLAEIAGVRQILLHNSRELTGHRVEDGEILWRHPFTNETRVNCSQPIPHAGGADQVFISTGYDGAAALLKISRDAGAFRVAELWKNRNMLSKFSTAIEYDGHVYGLDNGIMTCLELKSGKRKWKAGRFQHGQILLAGDLLLVQAESGDLFLVRPDPSGLRQLGKTAALGGKTWNHPALSGNRVLCRNDAEAVCLELPTQ